MGGTSLKSKRFNTVKKKNEQKQVANVSNARQTRIDFIGRIPLCNGGLGGKNRSQLFEILLRVHS